MTDVDTLARTIWGEARGEPENGRIAVGCVIRNRVNSPVTWWGTDYRSVCRKPWQFSCWNENDPNRAKLDAVTMDDWAFDECAGIAAGIIDGTIPDITDGATHYYATTMKERPKWAANMHVTARIGGHVFMKEI